MSSVSASKLDRFVEKYRKDHTHPVNHVLHVGFGWPMVGLALLLLPFRPLWSLGLFLGGYALLPWCHRKYTIFVIACAVIRGLCGGLVRLGLPARSR